MKQTKQRPLRAPAQLLRAVDRIAKRNRRSANAEIVVALEDHVRRNGGRR